LELVEKKAALGWPFFLMFLEAKEGALFYLVRCVVYGNMVGVLSFKFKVGRQRLILQARSKKRCVYSNKK